MNEAKTYRRIGAVKTAAAVLKCLARQKGPVPASQVAAELGLPAGTVACHLASLEDEGLTRAIGDRWELAIGMALFWASYTGRARAQVERLSAELHDLGA